MLLENIQNHKILLKSSKIHNIYENKKKNSRGPPAKIDGELQINSWKMLEESVEIKKITKNHNW